MKEYLITEWTSDHAHTSWWKEEDILKETEISRESADKVHWHCLIHEERKYDAEKDYQEQLQKLNKRFNK